MLGSSDNFVLKLFGQIHEIIAVAGHSHDQIAIEFRVQFGVSQSFGFHHIKLDMMPIHAEVTAHQIGDLVDAVVRRHKVRREFLVQ